MWWAMLAKFGADTVGGYFSGMQQRANTIAENAARKTANTANTVAAAKAIGNINVQKAYVRSDAARKLQEAERVATNAGSSATAQAAALGIKGASVDAVSNQIQKELGRAEDAVTDDALTSEYNLNLQIQNIAEQARKNLYTYKNVPSEGDVLRNAAMEAAVGSAGNYFSFGGGDEVPTRDTRTATDMGIDMYGASSVAATA